MFNQGEIAELLGVERETISRWKNDPELMFPCHRDSGGDGSADLYYPSAVLQWYIRHQVLQKLKRP